MIAIDFGTNRTCAAWINPRTGRAEVLPNLEGKSTTASAVYFGRDEVIVGQHALAMAAIEEEQPRVVLGAKRWLSESTALAVPEREVTAASVAAEIFRKLRRDAEREVLQSEVAKGVVTHPTGFGQAARDALRRAATAAGFQDVTLLEEPVAAALAYDRQTGDVGDHVLVCDLGAREFSFAFLSRTEDGSFRLSLPPRTLHTGGDELDLQLYDHCDQIAQKELGRPIDPKGGQDISFLLACRRQKEILSERQRADLSVYLSGGARFRHQIDRATFEGLVRGQAEQAARMARSLLDDAVAQGCVVQTVLILGGSARIPLVRELFGKALPLKFAPWPQQDAAVALGAAYFGDRDGGRRGCVSRVRVQSSTSLSDLIHRVASREADERNRMEADNQQQREARRKRVLDVFTAKADATEAEHKRLRAVLAQHVANRDYALAQETISALRRGTPDDTELQKAQEFLDTHHEKIGEIRAIAIGGDGLSVALSADGLWAAMGTAGNRVVFCDLVAGTTTKAPLAHASHVYSLFLTQDMKNCVTGCGDGNLYRWTVDDAQKIGTWEHGGVPRSVFRMLDGTHMLSAGADSKIRLWENHQMSVVCTFEGHKATVNGVDCASDGSRMVSCSADQTVRLWDIGRAREIRKMTGHRGEVRCVRFFPGGRIAVSAGDDWTLRLWDTDTGREMGRWEGHEGAVHGVEFCPDGRHAVSVSEDKTIRVWDVTSGWEVRKFTGHTKGVRCVAVTSDGKLAVSGSVDHTVRVWGIGV
jgi:molecular chaperone DnaK (HSP70)